tara:strand:- start:213740 stop:217108 length:3369 start_codon:yes stop_codon:yes gene_type:complete
MTIRVALHHKTQYRYERPIYLGPQLVRLRPAYHGRTKIDSYSLIVEPDDHFVNWQQDPFANPVARYVFEKPVDHLSITVDLIADMTVINPFDFFVEDHCDVFPFQYADDLKRQLAQYLIKGERTEKLGKWIDTLPKSSDRIIDWLVDVNGRLQKKIDYTVRMEPGVQSPEETLTLNRGSCRDSAWLLVETFRQLGVAARFVSGYLIQLMSDVPSLDGPSGPTNDFCDLHAWTEVYLPGAGWVGLDPTSGLFASEGHIPLACTPTFTAAAPITGGHEPTEVEFHHEMSVTRIHEDPRVTKPYTDAQWESIMQCGREVDQHLVAGDARLTMGGEPTFVSIDNMDDPQWSTEAVGEEKRVLSNVLLLKLRDQFAPGGMLHYGQGKWYPGESLPRWALTCLWRKDGESLWNDPQWIADEGTDYGHTSDDAKRFVSFLSRELGISSKMTFPVHEDVFHYLWREHRLPVDVDPTDPKLDDPNERSMMMRTFTHGLSKPVGYVLPLRRAWWQARPGWISGRWPVRGEQLYLIPGDSPIGLRLPLDTLPAKTLVDQAFYTTPLDPMAPRAELSTLPRGNEPDTRAQASSPAGFAADSINPQRLDVEDEDDLPTNEDVISTALCVECRNGRLHIFMPPTQRLEDYLDLVSAVEATCAGLELPVIMEGYLPPPDDRIEYFKVTPDPGVIEVNTQPSSSWDQLVHTTETLYEQARQSRLGTEKFDLDGYHTGTGGGNHIVMGGRSPGDSPFLRRPDLLGSLIKFWNNHPSLSYLFSGRFIGPTSQAPRMDEARRDAAYEMEIALEQLPSRDVYTPPWLVDRLFRDLLVDLTGNTHRAEVCIDKLYSPDSSTGRLGLVELRGFEMPPHARMSLSQQLLIRSIVAAFWEKPYDAPLTHWGDALHDRFLLPHFAWQDLCSVVSDLNAAGMPIDPQWYAPHLEFRFPAIGEVCYQGVWMRLRSAIEPWYVMGEEQGTAGTARFVDSSVERLQLLVDGMDPRRHAVMCNGRVVPLHPTGVSAQYVAGIKYRAWQPPRCLHPTIGIHTPLQIELVDRQANRSIGGCTYHAVHPAGVGHDIFPINALEAESRRSARFRKSGHRGGRTVIADRPPDSSPRPYQVTLDLRKGSQHNEYGPVA